ncbi:hypothetical protein [Sediminicola luteus]|uniref:DUF4488 domain-containing protein n=1 Tax=Sediminicola luteus TaxID=319238 RepID=A0A2A4GBR0_9FLAO|nr:hypothetical protein [Sediminicola luteus]PCE66037.1 hypothetical protein B7P33_01680 [Sediminicola luteus]
MKSIQLLILILACTLGHQAHAQNQEKLHGHWKTTYDYQGDKVEVTYQIKTEAKKTQARTVKMSMQGQSEKDDTLVMSNITMSNGKGSTKYHIEYEGEKYDVDAKLKLVDKNTLEVSYDFYGYSDTETWKRTNK